LAPFPITKVKHGYKREFGKQRQIKMKKQIARLQNIATEHVSTALLSVCFHSQRDLHAETCLGQ